MTGRRLHPRLLPTAGKARFEELCNRVWAAEDPDFEELGGSTAWNHHGVVFAATGPPRITEAELGELRAEVLEAAKGVGFPSDRRPDAKLAAFDRAVAGVWRDKGLLFPAEAAVPEIWSFHALVLLPDVAFWRFAPVRKGDRRPNRERFVGSDLTRHAFGRLWWRAHLVTARASDPDKQIGLLGVLGEADLDQILSRRRAYGGSPEVFREILRTWERRVRSPPLDELSGSSAGREILRDFLKRLLRRGAFVALDLLDGPALTRCLDALLDEALEASRDGGPGGAAPAPSSRPEGPDPADERAAPAQFDDIPLKDLVVHIACLVREQGGVPDDELASGLRRLLETEIPSKRERIVRRMAWVAGGFDFLAHDDEQGIWKVGTISPAPDRRWGDWTMRGLCIRASELLGTNPDPFEPLVSELFSGSRRSKLAGFIARAAIKEAQEAAEN